MNTLNRVILINAGGYSELELPCDGHVQIVGSNGHGKTTLLRAVLFFYVGNNDNSSFGIQTTQRDFSTHYLGEAPSYLIYEVKRSGEAAPFHVVVSRPSLRVQFLFIDHAYDPDLYIDPSRVVRSFEAVCRELDSRLIAHESVSSYEAFRQTIYGVRKSPYATFSANARASQQVEMLPRIISGIFTVNRMDASRLKRALCCGLMDSPQSLRIDLRQHRNNLNEFQRINRAVRTFLNNQQAADKIVGLADEHEEFSSELERLLRDFVAKAKAVPTKAGEANQKREQLLAEQQELNRKRDEEQKSYEQRRDDLRTEEAKLGEKIEQGEKREREYREKRISEKLEQLELLPSLEQKRDQAIARYEALTKEYASESKRRDDLLNRLKQTRDQAIAQLEGKKAKHQEARSNELEQLRESHETKRIAIEEAAAREISALTPQRMRLDAESVNLAQAWKGFHKDQEPEALARKRRETGQIDRELDAFRKRIGDIQSETKLAHARFERDALKLDGEREKLERVLNSEKQELDNERKQLNKALDHMERSIAALIRREAPERLPLATRTLTRDFLLHDASALDAKIEDSGASAIFGLQVDLNRTCELKPVEVDPITLQTQLANNQLARDAWAEKAESQRGAIEDRRGTLDKQQRKRIDDWDSEKSKLEKSIREASNNRIELASTLINLETQWGKERKSVEVRLTERETQLKIDQNNLSQSEAEIRGREKSAKADSRESEARERSSIHERIQTNIAQIDEQIAAQQQSFLNESKQIDANFLEELKAKGADDTVISNAKTERDASIGAVSRVESYRSEVDQYQRFLREDIQPLAEWRDQRGSLQGKIQQLEADWQKECELFSNRQEQLAAMLNDVDSCLKDIEQDNREIELFRKGEMAVNFFGLFADDTLEPAGDYVPGSLRAIINAASRKQNRLRVIKDDGDKATRRFLNKFEFPGTGENDLGFSPIYDGFQWTFFAGDQLRPFLRLNKIERFRSVQTKQFDTIISQIVREVTRIEDALRQVRATAKKVQNALAEEKFIDVLDAIDLRVQEETSDLWDQLKRMERFQGISFGAEFDLFQSQADEDSIKAAIHAFEALVKRLETEKKEALELEDCFEFAIRVVENGHDHGFRTTLDHIGSTGTDYLVKMLIYLSLIDLIRGQALAGESASIHCILDETGVLSPKYVKEAIRYAERKQIFLITAGHSATARGFRYWFRVRKQAGRFGGEPILSRTPICQ